MSREWKPGDVAAIDARGDDALVVRLNDNDWLAVRSGQRLNPYLQPRPLVVIDPESDEQMERLLDVLGRDFYYGTPGILAASLREFADPTPPKPEEPTGLGAVVEDERGHIWVRNNDAQAAWANTHRDTALVLVSWGLIAAVRVLSEGVTP